MALAVSGESGQLVGLGRSGSVTLWDVRSETARGITSRTRREITFAMAPLSFLPGGDQLAHVR